MKLNEKIKFLRTASARYGSVIDWKRCTVKFQDGSTGTGNPKYIELNNGEGTVTYTETKNREYIRNRGILDAVRDGQEEPVEVDIDLQFEFITGQTTTEITPEDVVKKRNGASDWVSTDSDACNPYAVDLVVTNDPNCSTEKIEKLTLSDFRYEKITYNYKEGTLKLSGKCNVAEATPTRVAQTT